MTGRPAILLLGGSGQLGHDLRAPLAALGEVHAPTSATLDVANDVAMRDAIAALRPAVIVNAAAYTAVDAAERDEPRARAVNTDAGATLGRAAKACGARVVHFSTDYVFSGEADRPWREDDDADPRQVYGRTKLDGERALMDSGADIAVLRASWLYGAHGRNFVRTILRRAHDGQPLRVVADQTGAPTWTRYVADAAARVVRRALGGAADGPFVPGVYHVAATGATTWHDFADAVLRLWTARGEIESVPLAPITSEELGAPARRPRYSVLDGGRAAAVYGVRLPDWRTQLDAFAHEAPPRFYLGD